jgi:hypothetical protein
MVGLMKKDNLFSRNLAAEWKEWSAKEAQIKRRTKIEYVTCPMTGTVEEMEVEDEDLICPVIREYEKYKT